MIRRRWGRERPAALAVLFTVGVLGIAVAAQAQEVVIGVLYPMTGPVPDRR